MRKQAVKLFHRTHVERLSLIKIHGILPPSEGNRVFPRLQLSRQRRQADAFIDSLAPHDIAQRRANGIYLFLDKKPITLFGDDKRVPVAVEIDPMHARVFDMLTFDNVVKELRRGGEEHAFPHAWSYWHHSVPLTAFLKHFTPASGRGWIRKKNAPTHFPERMYWPEVITMHAIEPHRILWNEQ